MKHFLNRIAQKSSNPSVAPVLTVALGDSVTQGIFEHGCLRPRKTYHALLQQKLEDLHPLTTFSTLNAGVGGETVHDGLQRQHRDVIAHTPDLVMVAFGLNDAVCGGIEGLTPFAESLKSLLENILQKTPADVLVVTPPCMAKVVNKERIHPQHLQVAEKIVATQTSGTLTEYNAASVQVVKQLRQTCSQTEQRLRVVDIHAVWNRFSHAGINTDDWLSNGLNHPDETRHQLAADLILATLLTPLRHQSD